MDGVAVSKRSVDEVLSGSSPTFVPSVSTEAALDALVLEARSAALAARKSHRRKALWLVPGAILAVGALTAGAVADTVVAPWNVVPDLDETVAVVAVNDQNEILLVRQYRNPAKQTLWEIPAGTMDNGQESPTECAVRELAEETGFSARNITPLFSGYLLPGYCNEYMHFFLATNLVYKPLPPDESEFIEVVPVSAQQADMLIEKGEIIDAKTVLGLLLARQHLTRIPT